MDEFMSPAPAEELESEALADEIQEENPPEESASQYPVFSLSPDGEIISATPEPAETDNPDMLLGDVSPTPAPYAVEVNPGDYMVIPGTDGNPTVIMQQSPADNPLDAYADQLDAIQSDIAYLASVQASNYGYLGAQALDTFDRVVQQQTYRYYCAFRESSDSYNGVLYLSDHVSRSGSTVTMEDVVQVRVYRTYSNNTYYYYYSSASAGDVSVNLSGNLMYYTNMVDNYPTLGGISAPYHYPTWVIPVLFVGLLAAFFAWRKRS